MSNLLVWLLSFVLPRRFWYRRLYLRSRHWREFRREIGNERGWRCAECGKRGRCDVHHKTYARLWREIPRDVVLMCRPCHKLEHAR